MTLRSMPCRLPTPKPPPRWKHCAVAETGARLLLVEDNKVNRLLLARNLELLGHQVATAENGLRSLQLMREQPFDLVLLDIAMPELDGFGVLEQMMGDLKLRDLPVIVTSALEGLANVVRCIELGADDYLPKPVNPVLLKARLNASLEKKRLRDQQKAMVRRFATDAVAQDLEQSGFALGGRRVVATVMFADIRGFTTLVEQQPPEETIELLNAYYALMFDAISGQGGVVNQMIGDGLMALFGAPLALADAPGAAAQAALDMIKRVQLFNVERVAAGKAPIAIGIGMASGEVIAGYTGTQQRATYTCIGDTVNLAARLEAHTKAIGQGVLMDEATCAGLRARWPTVALGPVALKGKTAATPVYALHTPAA
jgi:class 3 adenylate cyclase